MEKLRVDCTARTLTAFGETVPCAIGRSGAIAAGAKREGDGATPIGEWPILGALLRPDRVAPPRTALPWRWLRPDDGWSDDPADPAYNRPVRHPHKFSAEKLWRDDHVYNIIITLAHNQPPVRGAGSAIFWHATSPDFSPTEGCIAIPLTRLIDLVPRLTVGDLLIIRP
ncbi:MAG: L,D-transpeptidase family protein [Sphingomonadaceae bacterium]